MARARCLVRETNKPARGSSLHKDELAAFLQAHDDPMLSAVRGAHSQPFPLPPLLLPREFMVPSAKSEVLCEKMKSFFVGGTEGLLDFRGK